MMQNEMRYISAKNGNQLREFDAMMKVECQRGTEKYGENHSRHESLSVLEEEIYETEQELERIKYVFVQLKEQVFKDGGAMRIQSMLNEIECAAAAGMLEMMQAGAMAKKFDQYMQTEEP